MKKLVFLTFILLSSHYAYCQLYTDEGKSSITTQPIRLLNDGRVCFKGHIYANANLIRQIHRLPNKNGMWVGFWRYDGNKERDMRYLLPQSTGGEDIAYLLPVTNYDTIHIYFPNKHTLDNEYNKLTQYAEKHRQLFYERLQSFRDQENSRKQY